MCSGGRVSPRTLVSAGSCQCLSARGRLLSRGMRRAKALVIAAAMVGLGRATLPAALPYPVVDTAQAKCYNNRGEIAPPQPGQPFYGQDAQFSRNLPSYTVNADRLTVHDNVTGLTWQRSPAAVGNAVPTTRDKLTITQAQAQPAKLNAARFGGFSDWRLPSIKELYSLFDGRGQDPSGPPGARIPGIRPFIDTNAFQFAYGDESAGERIIDSQWASATRYVGPSLRGGGKQFGVNFADGRIKGYDLQQMGGREFKFYVLCVRGNPAYGRNDFHDNSDGTVTDRATGLSWSKADSGQGLNWEAALAWVQRKNAAKYLGHTDWRLPNVKELQSIVDYTRAPDTTRSPAVDAVFTCTAITNEIGEADYPFYWSGTTHEGFMGGGAAMYVAFGRASGWLSPRGPGGGPPDRPGTPGPGAGTYRFTDVHGTGAQRSDPKTGDPAQFPHGRGPQGDVIRIYNFVRLVRATGS